MRRKITVYGLRFSKTSFWNRLNTGLPDPAVATVLTACGIETWQRNRIRFVQKLHVATVLTACGIETEYTQINFTGNACVATVLTACGIETVIYHNSRIGYNKLQQYLPLAVLKHVLN